MTSKRKRCSYEAKLSDGQENGPPASTEVRSEARPRKREKAENVLERGTPTPLPPTSPYLPISLGGSHWHGRETLDSIVILGDSYSKLNGCKTWVDRMERRLQKQKTPAKIHNFASPGATAEDDLSDQLSRFFATFPKKVSPSATRMLDPDRTTYFVFIGINDCGRTEADELESIVEAVFDAIHDFYVKAGGRNFVLIDVPPIDRSPQALESLSVDEVRERVETWNNLLQSQVTEFGTSSKEATVLLFSSHQVLTEVLEDPSRFDFSEDDPTTDGGGIWEDDLHMTTNVHDILAERLLASISTFSQL